MATSTATNVVKNAGLSTLKDAGVSSVQIALAAGLTAFAIQAAVTAGKALIANGKTLVESVKL